jgi:hypothetical protein
VKETSFYFTLSPNLFRYMKILRMEWEGNRLNVAMALDAGRDVSFLQATANQDMAQRLGLSSCLDKAIIHRRVKIATGRQRK